VKKTVNISALLLSADENFAQEGDPRKLDKQGREIFPGPITRFPETASELALYDVILIGDVEPTFFTPTQMNLIIEHVRKNGAGLAWIAGPAYNPDSYRGTPLEVLLPVIPDDPLRPSLPRADNTGFIPYSPPRAKFPTCSVSLIPRKKNLEQMTKLPELYYYKPVIGRKPTTEVLAVHPARSQGGEPAPLIVNRPLRQRPSPVLGHLRHLALAALHRRTALPKLLAPDGSLPLPRPRHESGKSPHRNARRNLHRRSRQASHHHSGNQGSHPHQPDRRLPNSH